MAKTCRVCLTTSDEAPISNQALCPKCAGENQKRLFKVLGGDPERERKRWAIGLKMAADAVLRETE